MDREFLPDNDMNGCHEEDEAAILEEEAAIALQKLLTVIQGPKNRVQQRDYLKYTMTKNGNLSYIYLANNKGNKPITDY